MSNHHDQPPYRQADHDLQPYPRRRRRRDHLHDGRGYGGGISVRSGPRSPSPRDGRCPPTLRDPNSLRPWRNQDLPPPPPLSPSQPRLFRSDSPHHNNYPYPTRNPNHSSSRPRNPNSNNQYTGGCPFMNVPKIDRHHPQPDTLSPPQNSTSLPIKSSDNSTPHRYNTHLAGPYKPVSTSLSPVKPPSSRPRLKPATAPFLQTKSPAPSSALDAPLPCHDSNRSSHPSNEHPQFDRRSSRTLKCEKDPGHRDPFLSGRVPLQNNSISSECAAIARPTPASLLQHPSEIAKPNEQPHSNGSLSKSNIEIKQTEVTDHSREHERAPSTQRQSPGNIFKKASRVPDVPDEKFSSHYYPALTDKACANGVQMKEEPERLERPYPKKKHPRLRSVPAPSSKVEDTPQTKAGAAAMKRALQGEHNGMNPQNDCKGHNRSPSSPDAPYDAEGRREVSPERSVATRQNIESSMADMNIVDRKKTYSVTEREQTRKLENHYDSRRVGPGEYRKNSLLRGGNRGAQVAKRRTTDFDGSREPSSKRTRQQLSTSTVNVDGTTVLRRSRRLQSPQRRENKWETIKFEEARVRKLFLEQLRNQPMLLRISFLGMSDGDLRTTLDTWEDEKGLPEPDQRRLEINNNRIRHITDDVCERIAVLQVVSLNLSCNLLITIGRKMRLCSRLRFLNMSRNRLSSLPQELCDLTNLEVLNMSRNEISRLPSGLCRLKRLEVLSLAWNKLEVLPEDIAAEGAVLSDLDLSHNEKFHFFPRCTEHWSKLEVLHIPETAIHGLLSRREHRLRPAALVKELAGRKDHMFNQRTGLRSQSL